MFRIFGMLMMSAMLKMLTILWISDMFRATTLLGMSGKLWIAGILCAPFKNVHIKDVGMSFLTEPL